MNGKIHTVRALSVLLICIFCCPVTPGSAGTSEGINVILISIDALRADHLGCYGYERETSPVIDALAEKAVLFTRAYAQSSFTPPSHASIFTSRYVTSHGLQGWGKLSPVLPGITDMLVHAGYTAAGFGNVSLLGNCGFGRGFLERRANAGPAKMVTQYALEWLERLPREERFFLFLHYFDVHRPYDPEWRFRMKYAGLFKRRIFPDIQTLVKVWEGEVRLSDRDKAYFDALYDGEIRQVDTYLGKLFRYLKKKGLFDKSLIIVTADHGEMLGYHPDSRFQYTHDPVLYDGVIRVPLIIKFPFDRYGKKEITSPVESIDILPTVLGTLGLDGHLKAGLQGRDLTEAITAQEKGVAFKDFIISETHGDAEKRCIIKDNRKLIYDLRTQEIELYDLTADPLELDNIYAQNKERAGDLTDTMEHFFNTIPRAPETPDEPMPEEERERLKSLGYL
jgi:arylsulfatase A-like enzyme